MATIETIYKGELRTEATHVPSGNKITTDAPVDNNGRGEFFSPTDMVAAALGSCMLTIMDMTAPRLGVDLAGTRLEITKVMAADPRRICEIVIDFQMPGSYDQKTRKILENAAHTCPVSKSLHPELKQTIRFNYPD
ncbi:MAG: OsmC family protein [Alistipes sp.]|nr:OsmC family protein [Alistipes sp.]